MCVCVYLPTKKTTELFTCRSKKRQIRRKSRETFLSLFSANFGRYSGKTLLISRKCSRGEGGEMEREKKKRNSYQNRQRMRRSSPKHAVLVNRAEMCSEEEYNLPPRAPSPAPTRERRTDGRGSTESARATRTDSFHQTKS